jgi:hypothetical protein
VAHPRFPLSQEHTDMTNIKSSSAPATGQDAVSHQTLMNQLESWYRFDGEIADATGRHPPTVSEGSPVFGVDRYGKSAGALLLDGKTVLIAKGIELGSSSFAIQFWTLEPRAWFLTQGVGEDGKGLHVGVDDTGLRCDYWGNNLAASFDAGAGWVHWVISHDLATETKSIWCNGSVAASKVTTPFTGGGDFYIGKHFMGGGHFSGSLDDVAIWTRALSPAEIAALYDDGNGLVYAA